MIGSWFLRPKRVVFLGTIPAASAGMVLALSAATSPLPVLARSIAIGFLVASLLAAFIPKRRDVRTHLSVTCAIVAVTLSGQTRTGLPYMIACGLFAIVALACIRAPLIAARLYGPSSGAPPELLDTASAPRLREATTPSRRPAALAILAGVTAATATLLVLALPPAGAFAERRIQHWAGNSVNGDDDRVGFSTRVRVGSLNNMLRSDRVVMRIGGERIDYLRGVVLDDYESRIWSSTRAKTVEPISADTPLDHTTVHIELSRSALAGSVTDARWFLPADACDLHTSSGKMSVDPHGTAHPVPANDTREISFARSATSSCTAPLPAPALPSDQDLKMAVKIRYQLTPIAVAWTRGTTNTRERLDALMGALAQYRYSLEDRREGRLDPVYEFLTVTHRGHCELFASALALLARTVGIPTRLVAGYRVDEVNSLTGLSIVRDRDAHTWVEAWVGDRWMTFDPTPVSEEFGAKHQSGWDDFTETLSFAWDRSIGFIANIGLARTGIFAAVTAVVLIIVRRILRRGEKGKRSALASSRPLPAFETLATALASAGFQRSESEPLERFARRVVAAGEPWSVEVAEALARYAELRYGGIGEEQTIAERLEALARKIVPT